MSSKVSLCFLLWSFLQTSRFVNLDSCWWIKLQDELVLLDNSIWEQTFWFQLVRLMDYWIFRALNWSFPLHIFYQDVSLREGSKKNYESLDWCPNWVYPTYLEKSLDKYSYCLPYLPIQKDWTVFNPFQTIGKKIPTITIFEILPTFIGMVINI